MNTLNSKTNESNKFIYQFTDKLNLKCPNKNIALANLSIYFKSKNIKSEYSNNRFKISAPTWSLFKIKTSFKLELLSEETMQLLGSSKKDIDQNKDGEIVPKLETVEVVSVHCNLVNNNYHKHLNYYLLLCQINDLVN